ncbi:hypothetical protein G7Y89_g15269 [Cudoniella acicularis]|uniref:Heterokaryon incompatibility domain-containing protein n=1 Tax=Cudoniella acicularis TaxID=354080 RepID=A0A8H4VPW2_9HELO|nr:hypothetical protein G7Y89_g15269 [Cudoniella acicularis]
MSTQEEKDLKIYHENKALPERRRVTVFGRCRVLILEAADAWNAEIRCHLTCIDLQNLIEDDCEALSYTWDGTIKSKLIWVGEKLLQVTANLESFLRRRRGKHSEITLWVDVICINQADPQGTGLQIPFMGIIYSTASRLTIWFGKASDNSDTAMQVLRLLSCGSPYAEMPILEGETLTAMEKLFNRNWWSRIWILQEVAFGGIGPKLGKARVRCGHEEIMWTSLVIAATRMQAHKDEPFHHKIEQSSALQAPSQASTRPRIMNQPSFTPLFDDQPMIMDGFFDMPLDDWPETEW